MDFIGPLRPPTPRGHDAILVVVDRFTKRARFVPCRYAISARGVADIVFDRVVRDHDLPLSIISDRDPRFTNRFWRRLHEVYGTQFRFSSSYHPQTDGQTEITNRTLGDILRKIVRDNQQWDLHLAHAEIAYNHAVSPATGMSPYYCDLGYHPREAEIEKLQATFEELQKEKVMTSSILEKNMQFQKYLETVLEFADEYHEINDLLMRYATLEATNGDLKQHAQLCAEKNEVTRADLQTYSKMKTNEILNLNNEVSQLKKDFEQYERDALALQTKLDYTLQNAGYKTLQHGQVCMAVDNIFARCSQRSRVSRPPYSAPLEQLTVIGDFVTDIMYIIKQFKGTIQKKDAALGTKDVKEEPNRAVQQRGKAHRERVVESTVSPSLPSLAGGSRNPVSPHSGSALK
ncbi:hypothetical protein CBR_g6396 [Chara braunii]|uniref:Integrase catalytic domain-containing protein n=1 Tax=Chara braunii TaxID=69332 RepID=A0A388KJQ3_CHABU|nr:hypothetical protein CBR_g6396 [Chara braunii]|eukprot:GBG70267.1 hypothetical protein CBR_g6396 [Chara braunii]